ncbi:hypothetical protein NB475_12960 [Vibrio alginolyticus]|uniref:hypothetical protein n=1 Tax=Vibrio alginolyticus TaxID=663 RepID=UPI0019671519|nr:hypothetical protein [Vibrio alginolyticus]EJI1385449.1 hypothetical protein [Vibrio alginolyticus]MBN3001844.1 hypothetical protein [Vibrio alginolyticus]MCR9590253.1 hypothetical protein [Vibrio alginolyticus]
MSRTERNERAKAFITTKLDNAQGHDEQRFVGLSDYEALSLTLDDLIKVKAMGFRGVVATALTGMHLNPATYNPLTRFYDCNPRSIFEQGIFYAFEGRVPCGKSDPLNVAKNQYSLDKAWATGKRPQKAAMAAVTFLERVFNETNTDVRSLLVDFFFYRLYRYAESVRSIVIAAPEGEQVSHQEFAHKLAQFTYDYPESGTIPQLVISLLLEECFSTSKVSVIGGDESVFGTNTTSKKPADIWLELDSNSYNLYEVTVKKIDHKRLDDSLQALQAMDMLEKSVHFICRLPEDVSTLTEYQDGVCVYKGKSFNFVDLKQFILATVTLLDIDAIERVTDSLVKFIGQLERPISTKEGWNTIFN